MEGWIKLHRSIKENWIWSDAQKLKFWIDILLTVNHNENKVNIGNEIIICQRGQSIKSLKNWADQWNVSKDYARNFLELLRKDKMILLENLKITTRLTVCNYDNYQSDLHVNQTPDKRQANGSQTQSHPNKNDKKEEKENNEENYIEIENLKIKFENFRKLFGGSKRGLETEFKDFQKHKDWKEVILILETSLRNEINHRNNLNNKNAFCPPWANLKTWINQRRWEIEYENTKPIQNSPPLERKKSQAVLEAEEKERIFQEKLKNQNNE